MTNSTPIVLVRKVTKIAYVMTPPHQINAYIIYGWSLIAHMDHTLAEDVWLNFFPSVWQVLNEKQRESLSNELVPFICSGAHIIQRDCHPSALNTFVEAVSRCQPAIEIKPALLKYLGESLSLFINSFVSHIVTDYVSDKS